MPLSQLVDKVLMRKNGFCCLCFEELHEKAVTMENEVAVNIKNVLSKELLYDVFSAVFNDETLLDYVSGFNCLCMQCTQMAVNSYIFLKNAKENLELLTKVVESLSGSIKNMNDSFSVNTLYITLNSEDFSTKQYCDTKKNINTVPAAYKRFKSIVSASNVKAKEEEDCITQVNKKKSRSGRVGTIPTEEMMYDPNDSEIIKCKECFKVCPSVWALRNHFIRVHAPKVYKCPKCPRKYGSLGFLKTHKAESHCTAVCSECGKVFHNRHTLKMHELGHHMRIVCQKCGRKYKNKNTFNKHIEYNVCGQKSRASPANAKFQCDYCNKKYTQKVSLRVHIQFEHGNYKSFDCKWCQKKFWCKSRLNAHIVKHTQEKKFHCSTCNRNFVTKESLLYHTRIHTGEKPYECTQCDSRFLSASRRAEHIKRHHTGGTFECDICHSKFSSQSYMQKHKRNHLLLDRDNATELNKPEIIQKPSKELENTQFILPHQIPHLSSVYNYNHIYLDVGSDDYDVKIET